MTIDKSSFGAVIDANTRLVILGSLPGEVSLERRQYYAHPANQFWRLMEAVVERPLAGLPYPERLASLLASGLGLWDVIKSARRSGSLDADIRGHTPNALGAFAKSTPSLRALAFNGAKASAVGRRQIAADAGPALITLPSSSAAYCSVSFEQKLEAWLALRQFLDA